MPNPTGKGGFQDRPQDINKEGLNARAKTWQGSIKRITDMSKDELLNHVGGRKTRIGKLIASMPDKISVKDAMIISAVVGFLMDPNPRMLTALTDREEGKPLQSIDLNNQGGGGNSQPISIPAELMAPDFLSAYRDIKERRHTEYLFYGGRGSTKSSFVSLAIVYLIVNNPGVHGLIARQFANTMRDSVYSQLQWAIGELGLSDNFKCTTSPMEITYLPTGQRIYFRGLDEPGKIKSITPVTGHIGIFWIEEADQAKSSEHVRKVEQSLRGGDFMMYFKTWNPPRSAQNWINKYRAIPKPNQYQHSSNYLSVPREWLGEAWITEAEHLKAVNEKAYKNEYLGEVTGTGGTVFENVELRAITDKEIEDFDRIYFGLDWGYALDPLHWVKLHYDAAREIIYIFDEFRANGMSNKKLYDVLTETKNMTHADLIVADSAEPKSIGDMRDYGLNCRGAEKGPDSVRYSMRWLENRAKIVVDQSRCPYTAQEIINYEYVQTREGEFISEYPDHANHAIDSIRYALNIVWRRRGQ